MFQAGGLTNIHQDTKLLVLVEAVDLSGLGFALESNRVFAGVDKWPCSKSTTYPYLTDGKETAGISHKCNVLVPEMLSMNSRPVEHESYNLPYVQMSHA